MRILHTVESYYPGIGGMQKVVEEISDRLVQSGHQVMVATSFHAGRKVKSHHGVNIEQFKVSGNEVNGYRGMVDDYRKYLMRQDYDIMVNFAAQQWATDVVFDVLEDIHKPKVLVPTGFSALYKKRYENYFKNMPKILKAYDMNVFHSETYRDVVFAKEHGIKNRVMIPNAASEIEFGEIDEGDIRENFDIDGDELLIVHIGSITGGKGHSQAIDIFDRAKLPRATLLMIGEGKRHREIVLEMKSKMVAFRNNQKRVLIKSLDRQTTIQALFASDLFLFPSIIECSPLVLYEAAASGTPFLSTDVGNAKEIAEWTGGGWIMPTTIDKTGFSYAKIEEAAKMLSRVGTDKQLLTRTGKKARKRWMRKYTWEKIGLEYESLYKSLVN